MKIIFWLLLLSVLTNFYAQYATISYSNLDSELLNEFILKEVNALRKKAKVNPIVNETLLKPAADDHSEYLVKNKRLSHYQKGKIKKEPKNRVDYYGGQFAKVGENIQLTHIEAKVKIKREEKTVNTYSELAKSLVYNWEHSPPHYKNIINSSFKTTYTSLTIGENGEIYACQLFGSNAYIKPKEVINKHQYDIFSYRKCKRCINRAIEAVVYTEDSTVYMYAEKKSAIKKKL